MFQILTEEGSILNPSLIIGSWEWREPITTLTDQLTAFVCLFAFIRFSTYKGIKSDSFSFYRFFFLFFAIGMTSAAWLGHGLQAYLSFDWKVIGWVFSSIGFSLVELGTLQDARGLLPNKVITSLKFFVFIQFILLVGLMISQKNFIYPQLNSTVSLVLFTLPLQLYIYLKSKRKGHLYAVFTIIYAALPGIIYNNQISISQWFNYHDISHVLMAFYMFFFYKSLSKIAFVSSQ